MKTIFLIILLSVSKIFAQYTTPNTGVNWNLDSLVIYSSGVVTGSFPNYQINNNVIISASDKLHITAGSLINFTSPNSGIEVNGILKAIGTQTDSIIFTSTVEDSTGYYVGFRFNANSDSDFSEIRFARIYYADYAFRCISVSPVLSNSYIYKCGRGVQLSSSNAIITDNVIERCYEYGITMTLSSSPLIENNHLIKNNTKGTSALNQISVGLQGNNSPIIRNNIIEGGESIPTGGISLWVSGSGSFSNAIIEGNQIFNNSFGMTLYSTSNGVINAIVRNNVIYNNNINPNVMTSGSGININGSPTNQPIITGNTIYGNWWGITIQNGTTVQPGPQPNIGNIENTDTTDDGMNIIFGNVQGSNVYDLYNNCTNDIYAQNNDWRVYDSLSIEQHIFHKADSSSHGLVKFIPFSLPIPVELSSFYAEVINNDVNLFWTTSTETNNKGFEIERRIDDNSNHTNWIKIGFVEGKGTTTEQNSYSFADYQLPFGNYLYRLKQIDYNGSINYSQQINIVIDFSPNEFELFQNYPNPFNPTTKISFTIPFVGTGLALSVQLKVYDILGNEVATLVNEEKAAGTYEVEFNSTVGSHQLSSGVYFYRLQAGDFVQTKKMILMR